MERNLISSENQDIQNQSTLPKCFASCPEHQFQVLTDIHLKQSQNKLIFKCLKCVTQNTLANQTVSISEIAFSQDNHISDDFPILTNDLKEKIKKIMNSTQNSEDSVDLVKQYFKSIKTKIIKSIDEIENEIVSKAIEVDSYKIQLQQEYNKLNRKSELRNIIFDNQIITSKSEQAKIIIDNVMQSDKEIQSTLFQIVNYFNQLCDDLRIEKLEELVQNKLNDCLNEQRGNSNKNKSEKNNECIELKSKLKYTQDELVQVIDKNNLKLISQISKLKPQIETLQIDLQTRIYQNQEQQRQINCQVK